MPTPGCKAESSVAEERHKPENIADRNPAAMERQSISISIRRDRCLPATQLLSFVQRREHEHHERKQSPYDGDRLPRS
jgi:hypothetical protein